MHRIGGHLSTSLGYLYALESIIEKGGNALQIFSTSPRMWKPAKVSDKTADEFRKKKEELDVTPVFFHASYLVNLSDNDRIGAVSKQSLIAELQLQPRMGIRGSVVHLGSFKDKKSAFDGLFEHERFPTLIENIKEVLAETPEDSLFIIEDVATRKIGQKIEELSQIMTKVNSDRIRFCLDTCHLHCAGYDLSTEVSFEKFFSRFDELIGISKIELFHLNDSRDPFSSMRDRHENLGQGEIPEQVFINLLNNPKTKNIPFILETPGFDKKGPDKQNIEIAKSFINSK